MNQSPKEFEDNDPVIDAILAEYLGGKKPRALDSDSLIGIVANSTFLEDEEIRRLDFACAKAELDLEVASQNSPIHLAPKVSLASNLNSAPPRSLASRLALGSLAMLAACLLILASSILAINRQPNSTHPSRGSVAEKRVDNHAIEKIIPPESSPKNESRVAANADDLELPHKLPFDRDRELAATTSDNTPKATPKWSANQEQVLATINSQFQQLWQRASVVSANPIDMSQWARRASLVLTGKPVQEDKLVQLGSGQDSIDARKQFVDQILQSEEFTQHWSNRLLSQYFNISSTGGLRKENIAAAREIVASAIRENRSITDLWKSLLGSDESANGGLWLVAHKGQEAKASASQLLAVGSGNHVACAQCHRAGDSKLSEIVGTDSPNQFWNLAALLHKAQVHDDSKIEWQMDRELFYDSNDKRVLATPTFVTIDNSTPKLVSSSGDATAALASWGNWMSSSQKSREHFVETVWKGLFHLPLGNSIYDKSDYDELADLRTFLAQERVGTDDSLRGLVASIVLSDVFSVPTIEITESSYLVASDSSIEQLRQQMRLFSQYSVFPEPMIADNRQLVRWLATFNQPAKVLLAQPKQIDLENVKLVPNTASEKPSLSASQLEWLVRSKHYSPGTAQWIARLSDSQMNWEMVTNHVYFAELGRDANQEELQSAKAMLDISGNRKVALARILASLSLQ